MGLNDCVGRLVMQRSRFRAGCIQTHHRSAQNVGSIATTTNRSVKPANDWYFKTELPLTHYRRGPAVSWVGESVGFIFGTTAVALILIVAGLWLALASRRRKTPLVKISMALVGLLVGCVGLLLLFGGSQPVLP